MFGAGLIEQIPDAVILANARANATAKAALGIAGRPNRFRLSGEPNSNPNDGTIARFGWKAQNKSLLLFSGEAYNVEMGITNELFPTERDETAGCQYAPTPNGTTNTDATDGAATMSAAERFATFMRFLAAPQPSPDTPGGAASITRGRQIFGGIGCALCHTPTLETGYATVAALSKQPVSLYSDLMVHNMGPGLADDITQGAAGGDDSARRRSGAWASASSSCTTAARATCSWPSARTRARATRSIAPRRPTSSSTGSRRCPTAPGRIC